MTVGRRFLLTLAVVLAILLAIAAYGYFTGGWENDDNNAHVYGIASAQTRPELCMDLDTKERVRKIMFDALDDALHDKVKTLMEVWLRDPTDQPARAKKGLDNALRAYIGAYDAAVKFNPPECLK